MKDKLKYAVRAAVAAFIAALLGAAVAPEQVHALLSLIGL